MSNIQENSELLSRGVSKIIKSDELAKELASGKKLRIYLGVDPSSSAIHIGHAVILWKLREFQKLGHQIIFLIGDFTGQVGDPSGKTTQRQILTHEQVLENCITYQDQVAKILDFKNNPPEIRFNSEWLGKLTFTEVFQLASHFTVQQMLERDMFAERYKNGLPISLVEFMYPLMQGYDSVALDADVECGGNDQLFNMLAGRTLVERMKNKTKAVITFELLEGTDGRKMSKSFDNYIAINEEPNNMFGKIMSLKDELIIKYFTLATDLPLAEIKELEKSLETGTNPREIKSRLAWEITKRYHGEKSADDARDSFDHQFRDKGRPEEIEEYKVTQEICLIDLLAESKLVKSKSEAKRLVEQGGVKVNDEKVEVEVATKLQKFASGTIIQVGKLKYLKIVN